MNNFQQIILYTIARTMSLIFVFLFMIHLIFIQQAQAVPAYSKKARKAPAFRALWFSRPHYELL
jgi:hypothetical protein